DRLVFDDGYSLGAPSVRAAVARHTGGVDPDRVMTTSGSGEALALVMSALLDAGDEVVVVRPGYHLLVEYVTALGCTIKDWHLDPARDWHPDVDELAGLVTERTKAIIVNFPQNPTGTTVTEDELRRIVALAGEVGAWLLWDGAFRDLTYGTPPLPDVTTLYERAVSFGSFSKAFGLPGLRFGWCVAPAELLTDCVRIRDYTTLHVSPLNELLAQAVLENAPAFVRPRLDQAGRSARGSCGTARSATSPTGRRRCPTSPRSTSGPSASAASPRRSGFPDSASAGAWHPPSC
ncbi:aminotransferase class I/II-fold pyridoxal phosphate-dependent enzyme, partial [Streptomyces sp. OR43]|uniref:aminotransferase class I/II-fold pyridoxal phosphate-dependent enzyme n=1 Tax=Streptomyces sp. or43 TaxID=2478957 RepID=UPI0011CDDB82